MSSDFNVSDSTLIFDTPLKKPPTKLFISALVSISIGSLIGLYGIYGIVTASVASNSSQYLIGLIGYMLSAVIPIVLFQIFVTIHKSLSQSSKSVPYDSFAGISKQNAFRKVLAVGLLTAAFSVWVFLQPVAERFA